MGPRVCGVSRLLNQTSCKICWVGPPRQRHAQAPDAHPSSTSRQRTVLLYIQGRHTHASSMGASGSSVAEADYAPREEHSIRAAALEAPTHSLPPSPPASSTRDKVLPHSGAPESSVQSLTASKRARTQSSQKGAFSQKFADTDPSIRTHAECSLRTRSTRAGKSCQCLR